MVKKRRRKPGDRFPLLIYAPLWQRWGNLGILVFVINLILWLTAPQVFPARFGQTLLRHVVLLPVLAGFLMFLYGLVARKMVYVQCFPNYLRIQTPIYPLIISYKRIAGTRLVQIRKIFSIGKEKAARRSWPDKYWGMTAVSVELKSLPVSKKWLRLWFDKYLFTTETMGFVFLVEDWMDLSRQLNDFLSAYRLRRV